MIEIARGSLCEELTYFYIEEGTKHGFIIDPGADGIRLADYAKEKGYVIEKILLTHGHGDHMYGAEALRKATGAPIVMHREGKIYANDPSWNLSTALCGEGISFEADEYLEHGDEVALTTDSQFKLKMIHVPGHTTDGVAYYSEKEGLAFVGDIIFAGSVGRSDFPGGNSTTLYNEIKGKIFTLPDETVLLPGHGPQTTVLREKETNPVFNLYD